MKNTITLFLLLTILGSCNNLNNKQHALSLIKEAERLEKLHLPDSAFQIYQKCIETLKPTNEYKLLGETHLKIGRLLFYHTLKDESLLEYEKALQYGKKLKDKTLQSQSMRYIGQYYLIKDSTEYGINCVKDPLKYINQIKDPEEIAFVYNNLSYIYYEQKQYKEALVYNNLSQSYCTDSILMYKNYSVRGNIYVGLQQIDSAYYYFHKGLQSPNLYTQATIYYSLYQMDTIQKNYYNTYLQLADSIESLRQTENIAKTQFEKTLKPQRPIIHPLHLSIFIIFLTVLGIVWFFKHKKLLVQRKALLIEETNKKLEDKVNMLKETNIYKKVQTLVLEEKKHPRSKENIQIKFNNEEMETLFQLLEKTYSEFIASLKENSNPKLNRAEIMYCCLIYQLKLSNYCTSICLNVSIDTPRQYKKRIKEKLQKSVKGKKLLEEMAF